MQMNDFVIRRVDLWRGLYNVVSNAIDRVFCIAPGWSVMNRCWKDNSSIGSKSCLRRETGVESPILRYPSFPHPLTALRFNQITGISSLSPLPHTLELDMTISKGTGKIWDSFWYILLLLVRYIEVPLYMVTITILYSRDNITQKEIPLEKGDLVVAPIQMTPQSKEEKNYNLKATT